MNEEDKEQSDGWWILVSMVVLGVLAYQIYDATQSSIFDEGEE